MELVCAVNVNDIVHRVITTGVYAVSGDVVHTLSSAMDIEVNNLQFSGSSSCMVVK